jgi:hypothetical protein
MSEKKAEEKVPLVTAFPGEQKDVLGNIIDVANDPDAARKIKEAQAKE